MGSCTIKGNLKIITELMYTDIEKLLKSDRDLTLYQKMKMSKGFLKNNKILLFIYKKKMLL